MSHQFKPGDLAIIIASSDVPANLGRCVELVQRLEDGEAFIAPNGQRGYFRSENGRPGWCVIGDVSVITTESDFIHGFSLPDEVELMPLRGNFEFTKERVREAAHG